MVHFTRNGSNICMIYVFLNDILQDFTRQVYDAIEEDKTTLPATTMVFTADTVALLISPNNKSSAMFYHTKLNIHNLTYYNLKTKRAINYTALQYQRHVWLQIYL